MGSNHNSYVFINCPFDEKYKRIFEAVIFTIIACGFIPRCSKEVEGSARLRLKEITNIIKDCRYGIHDISRVERDQDNKLPRFNMPFELGIFYGAKEFGSKEQRKKDYIILERDSYRYQEFISDISGIDVKSHGNSIKKAIYIIRNWLVTTSRKTSLPHAENIYAQYNMFRNEFIKIGRKQGVDYTRKPFIEFSSNISAWLNVKKARLPILNNS